MTLILNQPQPPIELNMDHVDAERLREIVGQIIADAPSLKAYKCQLDDDSGVILSEMLLKDPPLGVLDLEANMIGRVGAEAIASSLEHNTHLHRLSFHQNPIGDEAGATIVRALKNNTTLRTLDLTGCQIGMETIEALAEVLPEQRGLRYIHLGANKLTDEMVKKLLEGAKQNFGLRLIDLEKNWEVTSSVLPDVLDYIDAHRDLVGLNLADTGLTEGNHQCVFQAFVDTPHPSYMLKPLFFGTEAAIELVNQNTSIGWTCINTMDKKLNSVFGRAEVARRLPGLEYLVEGAKNPLPTNTLESYHAFIAGLPLPPEDAPLTPELVTTPDKDGFTPLDNPLFWARHPNLLSDWAHAGKLTADFMSNPTPQGTTVLEQMAAFAPDGVNPVRVLNDAGIQIALPLMRIARTGNPSELAELLHLRGQFQDVFTLENLEGQPLKELKTTLATLPEPARDLITNRQQLLNQLGKDERSAARTR